MVSLQATLNPESKPSPMHDIPSKKRKCEDGGVGEELAKEPKLPVGEATKPADDIELHLDAPLPLEWQRCLDIKSGQVHFYNTRTHMRTSEDPRRSLELPSSSPVSLDLKLNINCEPKRSHADEKENSKQELCSIKCKSKDDTGNLTRSISWMSFDADQREMVAAVCVRCHMLVMMCKALPSCPNCKFVHPLPDKTSSLLKPGFMLWCCKD